jgi:hypothetical protein
MARVSEKRSRTSRRLWNAGRFYGFWNTLTDGLRTGTPQNEIKTGGAFFEVVYSDPAKLREFLKR